MERTPTLSVDIENLGIVCIKQELRKRNLSESGKKVILVQRLKDALLKEGVQIGSYPTEFFHPTGTPILDLNSSQYHSIPGTPFGSQISSSSLFESNGSIVSSKEPLDDLSMRSKANHQRSNYEIYQPKPKFNIYNYSLDETDDLLSEKWKTKEPQRVPDFLSVPLFLEQFIALGMVVVLDALLFVFTWLPIRFILAIFFGLKNGCLNMVHKIDILRILLIVLGFLIVYNINISTWDDFVKSSNLKLKMAWMCAEFLDNVLIELGNNIIGSLFWAVTTQRENVIRGRFVHFLLALGYIVCHSLFIILHISVINVAINESGLLGLLFLLQFAEMKGAVFKKENDKKLYDDSVSDVLERFKLGAYCLWILFFNFYESHNSWNYFLETNPNILYCLFLVYISEVCVDWVKHSCISNFNQVHPSFYRHCSSTLFHQIANTPDTSILTDIGISTEKGISLFPISFSIVILKLFVSLVSRNNGWTDITILVLEMLVLSAVLKLLVQFLILRIVLWYKNKPILDFTEKEKEN